MTVVYLERLSYVVDADAKKLPRNKGWDSRTANATFLSSQPQVKERSPEHHLVTVRSVSHKEAHSVAQGNESV